MAQAKEFWMYVGNYGRGEPAGIYQCRFDAKTGGIAEAGLGGEAREPNFVVVHPNGRFLYAVTSMQVADYPGAVEAFAIDATTGRLTFLNRQPSGGNNPAHLAIDPTGKVLIVANYSGGTIAAFPLKDSGQLEGASQVVVHKGKSVNPKRQAEPHPHEVKFDGTGTAILVADLGMDRILRYQVDAAKGTLTPAGEAVSPPGSGPRHVAFADDGRFFYVINELTTTLSVYSYGHGAAMPELQTLAVWPEGARFSGAEIALHPNGRWLYASNRGHDSLAICAVDQSSGKLKLVATESCGGRTPRHFGLDPTGSFIVVSNQDSNSIVVFRMDANTGGLSRTGSGVGAEAPCCVAFVPQG